MADELSGMADSVVIVVTAIEGERTAILQSTRGNEVACEGSVAKWLKSRTENQTIIIREDS